MSVGNMSTVVYLRLRLRVLKFQHSSGAFGLFPQDLKSSDVISAHVSQVNLDIPEREIATMRKLRLNKTTIRELDQTELMSVEGGVNTATSTVQPSYIICPTIICTLRCSAGISCITCANVCKTLPITAPVKK